MPLRKLVEIAARNLSIKRRMPRPFDNASIIVSPDSQLKYLKLGREAFDPLLLDIAAEFVKSNMIVWDVGANVGVFSVAAAALGAKVVAFEADPWLANLLYETRSLKENSGLKLDVAALAVSDRDGLSQLMIAARGRASNALEQVGGRSQMGGVRAKRFVPTLRLDTIAASLPAPHFLKVDVEGAEALVINGSLDLLASARPVLMIEVGPEHVPYVSRTLLELGYELFDAQLGPARRSALNLCVENTLAIPVATGSRT